jgi:hypothetical protein
MDANDALALLAIMRRDGKPLPPIEPERWRGYSPS